MAEMTKIVDELASDLQPIGGQYENLWTRFTQVLNSYTTKFVQSMNAVMAAGVETNEVYQE